MGRDVFVYFDNDVKVRAPFDAMNLAHRLKLCPVPPAGPIAAEEDLVAVRRPAQQLIIGRVLDQADFATPIGGQQEDVPGA